MDLGASQTITGRPGHERCSCPFCVWTRNQAACLGTEEPSGGRYTALRGVAISCEQAKSRESELSVSWRFTGLARLNSTAFDRYRSALLFHEVRSRPRGILG